MIQVRCIAECYRCNCRQEYWADVEMTKAFDEHVITGLSLPPGWYHYQAYGDSYDVCVHCRHE